MTRFGWSYMGVGMGLLILAVVYALLIKLPDQFAATHAQPTNITWERIDNNDGYMGVVSRTRIPQGWLVISTTARFMLVVEDAKHEWAPPHAEKATP